jgi:hypothetical protein
MGRVSQHTRRELLRAAALGLLSGPVAVLATIAKPREFLEPAGVPYRGSDDALLDEMERAALDFFWNEAGATTGQVKDRALLNGNDTLVISSIAARGLGFRGFALRKRAATERKKRSSSESAQRCASCGKKLPHTHGFYYHFIDMNS